MDNKDYNDYMMSLFKDASLQATKETNSQKEVLNNTLRIFGAASSVFNNSIALDFLTNLHEKYPTFSEKFDNYPEMFWKTPEETDHLRLAKDHGERAAFEKILSIIDPPMLIGKSASLDNPIKKSKEERIAEIEEKIGDIIKDFTVNTISNQKMLNKKYDHFDVMSSLIYIEDKYRQFLQHRHLDSALDKDLFSKVINPIIGSEDYRIQSHYKNAKEKNEQLMSSNHLRMR